MTIIIDKNGITERMPHRGVVKVNEAMYHSLKRRTYYLVNAEKKCQFLSLAQISSLV